MEDRLNEWCALLENKTFTSAGSFAGPGAKLITFLSISICKITFSKRSDGFTALVCLMINEIKVFCVTLFSKVAVACLHVTLQRILIGGESFSRNTSTRQVSDKA